MNALFHHLTREQLRDRAPSSLALLPVGATEQHGPHLPVGTDFVTVEYVAREAAARVGGKISLVVTPTLPFGSSHHHLPFGGTMSLGTETYYRMLFDLVESLVTSGFRRIFILNGHGGNNELIQLVARDIALKHPVRVGAASYWNIAMSELLRVNTDAFASVPGHSGIYETSQMLALHPELVQEPRPHREPSDRFTYRIDPPFRLEAHGFWKEMEGYTDSPDRATAEQGKRYLEAVVGAVSDALVEFCKATPSPPAPLPQGERNDLQSEIAQTEFGINLK